MMQGGSCCRKGGAIKVEQNADEEKDEDASFLVIEIKKTIFNRCSEHGWRLCFNAAQNSKPLQAAHDRSENNNNADLSHETEQSSYSQFIYEVLNIRIII